MVEITLTLLLFALTVTVIGLVRLWRERQIAFTLGQLSAALAFEHDLTGLYRISRKLRDHPAAGRVMTDLREYISERQERLL